MQPFIDLNRERVLEVSREQQSVLLGGTSVVNKRAIISLAACLISLFSGQFVDSVSAEGSSPFNMMNPSRWFGGGNRDYDDYYGYGYGPYERYGPYGEPGYGMPYGPPPPPGPPAQGAPYNFPPRYGYEAYGRPPAPQGYAPTLHPQPTIVTPQQTEDASNSRIRELEERIRQLEASRQISPQPASSALPQPPTGPSTWQESAEMPAPQTPSAIPSWQGSQEFTQPATQAPMPPPWQRSAGSESQATTESPMAPSWQGTETAPQMPATTGPGREADFQQQQLRFRPY